MFRRTIVAVMLGCLLCGAATAEDRVATGFAAPPDSARIWVYWFWLNGNITREGITADLEAMKRAGVGGVLIIEVDQGTPAGPVAFMSAQWRALFKYMVTEADRLGLEVNMNNDAGWNGSGGPWVPLDKAMQVVVTSETRVTGGRRFEGVLPMPPAKKGFYRDIAVLAFPTPALPPDESPRAKNLPAKSVSWPGGCNTIVFHIVGTPRGPHPEAVRESVIQGLSKACRSMRDSACRWVARASFLVGSQPDGDGGLSRSQSANMHLSVLVSPPCRGDVLRGGNPETAVLVRPTSAVAGHPTRGGGDVSATGISAHQCVSC